MKTVETMKRDGDVDTEFSMDGEPLQKGASSKNLFHKSKQAACKREHKKDKQRKKKWKKPKGKPNRPLSAYNLFFHNQRVAMLGDDIPSPTMEQRKKRVHCKTHGKIGFAEMAREIGHRWKILDTESRKEFDTLAKKERQSYDVELAKWKETLRKKADNSTLDPLSNTTISISDSESIHGCEKSVASVSEKSQITISFLLNESREVLAATETEQTLSPGSKPVSPTPVPNLVRASYIPRPSSLRHTAAPMAIRSVVSMFPQDGLFLQQMKMNRLAQMLEEQLMNGSITPISSEFVLIAQYCHKQKIAALLQR